MLIFQIIMGDHGPQDHRKRWRGYLTPPPRNLPVAPLDLVLIFQSGLFSQMYICQFAKLKLSENFATQVNQGRGGV